MNATITMDDMPASEQEQQPGTTEQTISAEQVLTAYIEGNIVDIRRFIVGSLAVEVKKLPKGPEADRIRAWAHEHGDRVAMILGEQARQMIARGLEHYTPPAKTRGTSLMDAIGNLADAIVSGSFKHREDCDGNCEDCPVNTLFGDDDDEKKGEEED